MVVVVSSPHSRLALSALSASDTCEWTSVFNQPCYFLGVSLANDAPETHNESHADDQGGSTRGSTRVDFAIQIHWLDVFQPGMLLRLVGLPGHDDGFMFHLSTDTTVSGKPRCDPRPPLPAHSSARMRVSSRAHA